MELLSDGAAIICWMDSSMNNETVILMQKIHKDGSKSEVLTAASSTDSRSSGFPRIAIKDQDIILAYTSVLENNTSIKTKKINLNSLK